MLLLAVTSQVAALSGPVCTRPALRAPVISRAARRVVCAEAEAESKTNAADEGRNSGVRGARIIGFAGGAVAGRCCQAQTPAQTLAAQLHLPLLHTAPRGRPSSRKTSSSRCLSPRRARPLTARHRTGRRRSAPTTGGWPGIQRSIQSSRVGWRKHQGESPGNTAHKTLSSLAASEDLPDRACCPHSSRRSHRTSAA